jgi:dUTPase
VILPIITPETELVDALEDTERGNGGFGSTGKF